jgi:hypothetical protein
MKILLLILLFAAACGTDGPAPQVHGVARSAPERGLVPRAVNEAEAEAEPIPFAVVFHSDAQDTRHAMHEPPSGVYTGAWLLPEMQTRDFEAAAGRHAVYAREMYLDEEVPATWLLHMIAAQATPLIIIHPPTGEVYDIHDELLSLARRLGAFNLPMFIAFYPAPGNTAANNLPPAEYTSLFRFARAAFHMHTPLAAMVWVAPGYSATATNAFFPGQNNTDWVALPLLAGRTDGQLPDALSQLEEFYFAWRDTAPIMLLPLGLSHFSRGEYRYHIHDTASELTRIYSALAGFPRVGLVVYADGFIMAPDRTDAFSISNDPDLLAAYREATTLGHMLPAVNRTAPTAPRTARRSRFAAYYFDGEVSIDAATLAEEIRLPTDTLPSHTFCTISRVVFIDNTAPP